MATRPDPEDEEPSIRNRVVARMAALMANEDAFGTGPLAELRRLDPAGTLAEPALHRLLARHVTEPALKGLGLPAWALVVHCTALAAPKRLAFPARDREPRDVEKQAEFWADQSRQAQQRLGLELWGDDSKRPLCSERRFVNLLEASADEFRVALPRAVRFLVARGGRLPVLAIADLVASAGGAEDWAHAVRHRIARGYYRAESKSRAGQNRSSSGDAA